MRVSIIVPLYNKAATIQRTLDSILVQTCADFEAIIVDDGSSDDSGAIVAGCSDPRVRLLKQSNAGPGAARNRGLAEARGRYVAFLDADDEWLPFFLERSLKLLEDLGPAVASVSSGYFLHPAGQSTTAFWRQRGLGDGVYRLHPDLAPQFVVHLLAFLSSWNTVVRIEKARQWGGFYAREKCLYGEDSYFWLKLLLNEAVAVNLEPLVRFHTEASALSHNLRGPRPVEPLLRHPAELAEACPPSLRSLLTDVLALRAIKTACMLGYWGRWREGRALLGQFCTGAVRRWPRYGLAQLVTTPVGASAGAAWRLAQRTFT